MKPTFSETEMFRNVEHLDWFIHTTLLRFLVYDEIYVNIGVDKISIRRSPNRALNVIKQY